MNYSSLGHDLNMVKGTNLSSVTEGILTNG